jgi:hypothetical protein
LIFLCVAKPLELASPEERDEMLRKREESLKFFAEMESNILKKFQDADFAK